jgi:SAM-dependent MidA family methyltransferase
MTPLDRALRERISSDGPITVEAFMEVCNGYYYATRDPLGLAGDFVTAPEISQMFGELVGAALADVWSRAGKPQVRYVELGPGRGTLASDALRVMRAAGLTPPVHFVETSQTMRAAQRAAVPDAAWHERIDDLPGDKPLLVVANEFLDALPIRQHVAGVERRVTVAAGGLAFDRDGEIVESSPARDEAVLGVSDGLVSLGGAALFIDYGFTRSGSGDTFQSMKDHRFTAVLDHPGEQDLTSHVDFQRVAEVARKAGAAVDGPSEQGPWLEQLGIMARARVLANGAPQRAAEIEHDRARLCRPDQMGSLFKVLAIRHPDWPSPAGL